MEEKLTMIPTTFDELHEGDRIAFEEGGTVLTVHRTQRHSYLGATLGILRLVETDGVTVPLTMPIFAVEMFRDVEFHCVNPDCDQVHKLRINTAAPVRPGAFLCDSCMLLVTVEPKCTHPNGYEYGSCPICGEADDMEAVDA